MSSEKIRILHLEDEPQFAEWVHSQLEAQGWDFTITRVETRRDFIRALDESEFDIILADHALPGFDGLTALSISRRKCPNVPFLFVSGTMGEDLAVDCLKKGATDYILKSNLSRFIPAMARALESGRDRVAYFKAKERIRREQSNLRALTENTPDAIWSMDLDFRIQAFNSASSLLALKMAGQPMEPEDIFLDYLPLAAQGRWRDAAKRILAGERFQEEHELAWNGMVRYLDISFNPIATDNQVNGMAVFCRDVTERKRSERAILESEERYRRLLDVCPDSIFIQRQGTISLANHACVKLLGASESQRVLGQPTLRFFPPEFHERVCGRLWQSPEPGKTPELLVGKVVRFDGVEVDVEVAAAPFWDQGDLACQVVLRDITERKKTEGSSPEASEAKIGFRPS